MFNFRSSSDAAVLLATRTPAEKVQLHIDRYKRAIDQCEKGPERRAQLNRERDFWRAVAKAQRQLGGE